MPKRVVPPEAAELVAKGWTYVDVRSVAEYDQGHPQGGYNVPLVLNDAQGRRPNPDFQKVMEAHFPKDAPLVIGCLSGGRSLQAATLLEAQGYTQVVDMRGGWGGERDALGRVSVAGWQAAGLPAETAAGPGRSWAELAKTPAR